MLIAFTPQVMIDFHQFMSLQCIPSQGPTLKSQANTAPPLNRGEYNFLKKSSANMHIINTHENSKTTKSYTNQKKSVYTCPLYN